MVFGIFDVGGPPITNFKGLSMVEGDFYVLEGVWLSVLFISFLVIAGAICFVVSVGVICCHVNVSFLVPGTLQVLV